MIFRSAGLRHLALARILIFSILLLDLLLDNLPSLASMPRQAFLPHGLLRLIPEDTLLWLLQENSLRLFSYLYGLVLCLGIVGLGPAWIITPLALAATTLFHGLARGFGGHVNHQELITLHAAFFLLFPHAFKSLSLNARLQSPAIPSPSDDQTSRFLLRSLTFWIFLTYFFIGLARLQTSDWRIYNTNAMTFYAVLHSTKWNYWDFSFARGLLDQKYLNMAMQASFPLATLLEIAAPFALFFRRLVVPFVVMLVLFHTSILLFMNIFFWQNLLLMLIPLMGWYIDRRWTPAHAGAGPLLVFYDATCGMCDGFIRAIAKADTAHLIRFAPLDGSTAAEHHIQLPENRATWTIMALDGDHRLERSDAVLRILSRTTRWADLGDFLHIFPRPLRDLGYRIVARYRYLLAKRKDACGMPDPALRAKLLP
jgi:predicted DCC family thiol-disulfide oxidoreductase YuxK